MNSSQLLSNYGALMAAGCILLGCIVVVVMKMIGKEFQLSFISVMKLHPRARLLIEHRQTVETNAAKAHSVHPAATAAPSVHHGGKKWFYTGPENKKKWPDLNPSPIYAIPRALPHIGDKSDRYAQLRKDYDEFFPPGHPERSLEAVKGLHNDKYEPVEMSTVPIKDDQQEHNPEPYDIYNCPDTPPQNYPYTWNLVGDVLRHWPTDDIQPRSKIHQTLCVFDYARDYDKALAYRKAEVPFVVVNDPEVAEAVERWNTPGFFETLMGNVLHRCEYSKNNHFMYWIQPSPRRLRNGVVADSSLKNWTAPTDMIRMKYSDWLKHANVSDDKLGPDKPHWYYRLIGCGEMGHDCDEGSSEYLFDELTFFQPRPDQLYLDEYQEQKGIHCRFGMRGVIAENHYDGSRNAIALLGGERRYILAHPKQCKHLALYPNGHPSARHSAVDWSNPDLQQFPEFSKARANEVVMQAGDVLYLPTNWFHYIISLQLNYQCNTRSGVSFEYHSDLKKCGF